MLDKVKLALRISGNALNEEVSDLINAAIADLRLVGISVPEVRSSDTTGDPILDRAIILYAKSEDNFGGEGDQYRKAYDYLKCALSLSGHHTESEGE